MSGCFPRDDNQVGVLNRLGATRGVMVSTSAFLECGFESWFGLEFSGFRVWQFLKLRVLFRLPPLLHRLMVQLIK